MRRIERQEINWPATLGVRPELKAQINEEANNRHFTITSRRGSCIKPINKSKPILKTLKAKYPEIATGKTDEEFLASLFKHLKKGQNRNISFPDLAKNIIKLFRKDPDLDKQLNKLARYV